MKPIILAYAAFASRMERGGLVSFSASCVDVEVIAVPGQRLAHDDPGPEARRGRRPNGLDVMKSHPLSLSSLPTMPVRRTTEAASRARLLVTRPRRRSPRPFGDAKRRRPAGNEWRLGDSHTSGIGGRSSQLGSLINTYRERPSLSPMRESAAWERLIEADVRREAEGMPNFCHVRVRDSYQSCLDTCPDPS